MNSANTQARVAQRQFARMNDTQRKIVLLTAAILVAMVLFPPKGIATPSMFGGTQGTHWGYCFVTSDPAAEAHGANDVFGFGQLVQGYIEWGRLAVQLAVVSILGFVGVKALDNTG